MKRATRTLAVLGGVLLAAVLVVGFTPVGTWLLDRLVRSVAVDQGWSVSIAGREGTLATGFALTGMTAECQAARIEVALGRLEVSPWSYAVAVHDPRVTLEVRPAPPGPDLGPSPPPRVPVEYLPAMTITGGRVEVRWPVDHRRVVAEGLELTYAAQAETLGIARARVARLAGDLAPGTSLMGSAHLLLHVGPSSLVVDTLGVEAAGDSLSTAALLRASLALLPTWPMTASLEARGAAGTRSGQAQLTVAGQLEPLGLSLALRGQAETPEAGPVALQADGQVTTAVVRLDSARLWLLGGEVAARGAYHPPADSLEAEVTLTGIEPSRLVPAMRSGPLNGTLRVLANTKAGRYQADLDLTLARLGLTGHTATEVRLTGHLRPDRQLVLALSSQVLDLTAAGWAELMALPGPGSYDLRLDGTADLSPLVGAASPPVRLRGTASPDTVRLWLDAAGLPGTLGRGFGPASLAATLLANRYLAAHLDLERGLLAADLGLDLQGGSTADSLVAAVHSLELGRLAPGLTATVRGQVRVAGLLAEEGPRLTARLETDQAAYAGWHTGPLTLDLARRDRTLTATLTGTALSLQGRLGPDDQLHAELACNGVLLRGVDSAATAGDQVAAAGSGTWDSPVNRFAQGRGRLDLSALDLRQAPYEVSALAPLRVRFEDATVLLDQVRLQTPVGPLEAAGTLSEDTLAATAEVAALDLSALRPGLSHRPGTATLHLGGSARRPEIHAEAALADVRLDSLLLGDARLRVAMADTLTAALELLQGAPATSVVRLGLIAPAAPLVRGVTPADQGEAVLSVEANGADLAAPLTFALGQPASGRLSVAGKVSMPLARLDSTWTWRTLHGDLRFDEVRLQTVLDEDSLRLDVVPGGRVVAADDQVELHDLRLNLSRYSTVTKAFVPSGRLLLAGELRAGSEAQLTADLEDADLLLLGGPSGRGSLRASVTGTLTRPEVQVDLEAATDELGSVQGRFRGDVTGGRLDAAWTLGPADSLVVDGEMPWSLAEGRFDYEQARLHLQSAGIDLALLENLVPQLDRLRGRVSTDLQVNGLGSRLDLQGEVAVQNLEVGLLDIKPVYVFPAGRLVFSGRQGELQGFTSPARAETGAMTLTGGLDLSKPADPRYQLRLQTNGLVCQYLDLFRAPAIDLDVTLDGSLSASRVAGSVKLREPVAEPILVTFNAPPVPPPPPTLRNEFLENMSLGIQIDLRDLKVDSELAEVHVSGAVDVGGTFYKPVFQGDIGIDRGQVYVLNRQFDFDQGRIVLNSLVPTRSLLDVAYDPFLLNPDLDLSASCKVTPIDEEGTEYTVTLSIEGPVQTAAPVFTSDPTLDSNGIFRLLAFGSVASQLQYSAALGTAAGQLLSKKVEKVGLDEFRVLPSTRPEIGAVGQPSLRLGKYFGQSVFPFWVRYEAAIGEMSSGEVRTEYKLRPYLTLSGTAQSRYGRYGLGLGLKKDF